MTMKHVEEGKEPQVLCVDDQYEMLYGIMSMLEAINLNSIGKLTGQSAIDAVRVRIKSQINSHKVLPLNMIVVDFQMP